MTSTTKPPRRKSERVEDQIQRAVIDTARLYSGQCPALKRLYAIPNGGQRSRVEAAILKGLGVRAGMPDLHLPVGRCHRIENHLDDALGQFHSLFFELKKPGGVLSEAQRAEIGALQQAGNCVQVCDSLDKAWAVLCWYLAPQWDGACRSLWEVSPRIPGHLNHSASSSRFIHDLASPRGTPWFEGQTPAEAAGFLRFVRG